jgi:hypothetical protein
MLKSLRLLILVSLGLPVLALSACGPGYLDAAEKIEATGENKEVFEVVKQYHTAVENKDIAAIKAMVSERYHENAGTTDDPSDDYGYDKLMAKLEMLVKNVRRVQFKIRLVGLDVHGEDATVDFEYIGRALLTEGGADRYSTFSDFKRMVLVKESGNWRILGGL